MELQDLCKLVEIFEGKKKDIQKDSPWKIGRKYFIQTVTFYYTGVLVAVTNQELVLEDAAWIPDTGRFSESIKEPTKFSEIEPFNNPVFIGRGSIVSATEIPYVITKVK